MNALKIDQSLVHEITADEGDATIVGAMINIGKGLKKRVIAEGSEARAQLNFLHRRGRDEGQGYYFSRTVVAQQFAKVSETGLSATLIVN